MKEIITVCRLTTNTRSGTFTVAGTTSSTATNVTVNGSTASRYVDATFAKDGFTLTNGTNTFTAIAQDSLGRTDTNSVSVNLPATVTFAYDGNGNLTSDGQRGFDYDDENQLIRITVTNAWKSEFTYDGKMRRRITKEFTWQSSAWALTNEVHYVYDGNLVIQERDGSNNPLLTYTRGLDLGGSLERAGGIGGLLARTDANGSALYHSDANGNVTTLVNGSQAIVAKYLYDPFGNTLSMSGPLASANTYRFSSKDYHANSGLVCYMYRFYDPNTQRWVNRDPIEEEGGLNLYEFTENGPIGSFDPDGADTVTFPLPKKLPLPPGIKPPVPFLGPIGLAITCGSIGASAINVGSTLYYDRKKKICDKEWDDAFNKCKEELSKPNPSRGLTGGHDNIMDCARGLVSEDCGGNPVDRGKKKQKPRTIRFK